MPDIPVNIPAAESLRDIAVSALYPSGSITYDDIRDSTVGKMIDRVCDALRDQYILGDDAVTQYQAPEKPKDQRWLVAVPVSNGYRSVEVVAPEWMMGKDSTLVFGVQTDTVTGAGDYTAIFAAGRWESVVLHPKQEDK